MAQTPTAFDTTVLVDLDSDNGMKYKMPRHGPHTPWSPVRNRRNGDHARRPSPPSDLRTPTTRWPATCSRGRPRQLAPNVGLPKTRRQQVLPKKESRRRLSRKVEQQEVRELYDNSLTRQRTIEVPVDSQYRQKYIDHLPRIVVITKLRREFRS